MASQEADTDSALSALLGEIHRMQPSKLPQVLTEHCPRLGLRRVTVYLADLQQRVLIALPDDSVRSPQQLPIDSSLAGWAYRSVSDRMTSNDSGGITAWVPLIDGIERIGVLHVEADSMNGTLLERCRTLSTVITLVLFAKGFASDIYARSKRTEQMNVSSEMVWAFLPPRSVGSHLVTSSAVLEPAYDLGGDAFDHTVVDHTLHATLVDGMGHDIGAGLSAAVALAACRNARRSGADLRSLAGHVDRSLVEVFGERRHATAVFAHLDLVTGMLEWVNAGHPPPLLLRDGNVVAEALEREAEVPLGLPSDLSEGRRTLHHEHLQPGDRVLLHTDGVVDAQAASGERFGMARFTDFVLRAMAADEPPPEALRRLIHDILEHQEGRLSDDATIMLFQWHPAAGPDYYA